MSILLQFFCPSRNCENLSVFDNEIFVAYFWLCAIVCAVVENVCWLFFYVAVFSTDITGVCILVVCSTKNVYRCYYGEVLLLSIVTLCFCDMLSVSFVVVDVRCFTCLDNRLYVVYRLRPTIHVYTADTFSEVSVITVDGLKHPEDIVACHDDHQLYVIDWGSRSIWRVSAVNPTDYEKWLSVDESHHGFYTLSLTSRRLLVLVTSYSSATVLQYNTVNKELLRVIELPNSVRKPTHAVETSRDTFVVSHLLPHSAVSELFSFFICLLVLNRRYHHHQFTLHHCGIVEKYHSIPNCCDLSKFAEIWTHVSMSQTCKHVFKSLP